MVDHERLRHPVYTVKHDGFSQIGKRVVDHELFATSLLSLEEMFEKNDQIRILPLTQWKNNGRSRAVCNIA